MASGVVGLRQRFFRRTSEFDHVNIVNMSSLSKDGNHSCYMHNLLLMLLFWNFVDKIEFIVVSRGKMKYSYTA
jgi:hypothetical protein